MLEHCTYDDCDEALAGDLLEGYSAGLSDGWYCRQVFAACAVSWTEALRARKSMLIFALLWSMMAPAWKMFLDGIEGAPIFDTIFQPMGGFWLFPALAGWMLLNATFVWAGMLVYILAFSICGRVFRRNEIRRAFLLTPFVYAPVFGAWFAFCCLDWSFSFADQTLATTPLGQIADLRLLADVLRFPYFITMVYVLWNAVPRSKATPRESCTEARLPELVLATNSYTTKQFFFYMVNAGLINAVLAGILLCRLPELHLLSFSAVFPWALLYVVVGALAGVVGSWLYWKSPLNLYGESSPIPFPLFALLCTSGWIWIPSIVLLSEQSSAFATIIAVIGSTALAVGLRNATFSVFASFEPTPEGYMREESDLFAESLYRAPREAHGYVISLLLYAGFCALAIRSNFAWNYAAAVLFALSAFLFVWKQTIVPNDHLARNREYRRAALRLALVAIPAILVTAWALLDGVAHRNRVEEMNAAASIRNGDSTKQDASHKTKGKSTPSGLGGYESLILWPVPEKKQIVPPIPSSSLLARWTTQPLVIRFNGAYWYLQPPNKIPGPTAHQSQGTPIRAEIASINATPLVMDAHQFLGAAIPIARCREIQVEIENRDNRIGAIALAVLLTNGASIKSPTLYLGQHPIVSTEPEHFLFKKESVFETLRFPVPPSAKMRKFDEITLMILPDVEHSLVGPKIAIKQFQLFPR
jgi:hypothetical protein